MSSILEKPQLNKIFLLYGSLDDMFITPDLQRNNFRPFLNTYLRSLGYQQIVYYSGAKNTGKYVLDDKSAMLAINKNKIRSKLSSKENDDGRKKIMSPSRISTPKKNKIQAPSGGAGASQENNNINKHSLQNNMPVQNSPQQNNQAVENNPKKNNNKLIYKQPKITPAEFLDEAKRMMSDSSVKTAVIFTFFQDFATDGGAPIQQYSELLSHLWDEYSIKSNDNICLFLAPQMDTKSISDMFDRLTLGDIFRNRFFNSNGSMNQSCTIQIGLPNQDEFGYMLDYLRICGDSGRRITYSQKHRKKILSALMYLSREADREENRAGYLSSVYQNLVSYMKAQPGNVIPIDENIIKKIYSRYHTGNEADPMETLTKTKGWEAAAKRITDIIKDYQRKKAEYISSQPKISESRANQLICSNERIDTPETGVGFEYPIPRLILKGRPGVGKTTIARLIGQIFYEAGILKKGMTIEATAGDLIDRYVGGTTVKTRELVMNAEQGVLFIDDAYSLIEKSDENNYSQQAIDELVAIMTNPRKYHLCIIMAGYPDEMDELLKMNSGLRSRFGEANIINIEDYQPEVLQSIFEKLCKKDGYHFQENLDLKLFFENYYAQRDRANFGNARDVKAIAEEVKLQASLRDEKAMCITQQDFGVNQKYFKKNGASSIDEIYAELDNYVGMEFVKELFDGVRLELLDIEDCKRRGIKPDVYPDHYIFSGNPGTGKTTVGKLLGKFYNLMGVLGGSETIFTDASDLIGTYVGDSKERTLAKIQEAIDHNSLLYIDEAYQITDSSYSSEIVGAMMTRMTENAADFKMVLGMYKDRVEDFLKLNSGLSRRVRVIEFPDYNAKQLTEIFDRTIQAQGRTITEEAHQLIELIMEYRYNTRTESFGNAGEVKKLAADMKKLLLKRTVNAKNTEEKYIYTKEDIPAESIAQIKDQINPRTFSDIMKDLNQQIGLSDLKKIIMKKQEAIEYARRSGSSLYDISPGYYFFVGNPGTGKSTSAKLFGEALHELGIVKTDNFYSCTAKDLIGQYVGETDKKTYELLKKSINGVLFIDEAYSLSYAGEAGNSGSFKKEALEQIIAFLDEPEHRNRCCIIFAGYLKDMQGLYQSNSGMRSRIEEVYFKDYTAEELYQIFELFCQKNNFTLSKNISEIYLPIFKKMVSQEYYSNGRTARTVYEKTIEKLKHRVVTAESITPEQAKMILPEDTLSEKECMAIVNSN